jgi:hypothetical protein
MTECPANDLDRIMLSSALLLASLAILAPGASGQQCDPYDCSSSTPAVNLLPDRSYSVANAPSLDHAAIANGNQQTSDYDDSAPPANVPEEDSNAPPKKQRPAKPPDFNRDIYYKNKLEFSLDGGWLPVNIPLPFDFASGDGYNTYPLKYTLVPIIASLRWHMNDIGGPWFLRGNFDFQFSGSVTAIPRGPESRYLVYIMGMRRNFVPRNSRIAPYFDVRLGVGNIDAKGPIGFYYAQGEPLTFTFNFGSGVRYNFNPRYAISAGVNYMHISNANISQGNGYTNYGINVLGPMVGIDVQLRRRKHSE